ncbi:hypothetical protein Natpe_4437 (plasmid) [Natrinema pellirubrum DSM 15624]|uniref:Uncharacterized protein n=1 Tax=Natrinema pellirubrum (strain DSM 15624 / CIP 106293 / JCM 10476 / NCIMB 786 / 157) TaxID=797303 RepID=L0JU13_NATP1|nr:hypothetical protein Natpe_4437 [Natrinema pellirubrum DSM 15624]
MWGMSKPPTGQSARCPEFNAEAMAIIPQNSFLIKSEENADGKAWVNCRECGERFLAFFQFKE